MNVLNGTVPTSLFMASECYFDQARILILKGISNRLSEGELPNKNKYNN